MSLHKIPFFSSYSKSLLKSPFFSSPQLNSSRSLNKISSFSSSLYNSNRGFSSIIPSPTTVEVNYPSSSYPVVHGSSREIDKEDQTASIPVRAYFFSTSIDLNSLMAENQVNFIPPTVPVTNHVLLRFRDTKSCPRDLEARLSATSYSYMVVFQYGSIITFNIVDGEVAGYLKIIEKHASCLLPEMSKDGEVFLRNEINYEVREKPNLPTWMQVGLDYIVLQQLDIDGIRMIGSVLGQSIALDYYVRQVDGVVAEFTNLNRGIGKFFNYIIRRKKLNRIMGKGNSTLADVVVKHRLLERSEIARKDAKYAQMWDYLRDIFKLTQRVANFEYNLKLVEENTNFLTEEMEKNLIYIRRISIRIILCVMFLPKMLFGTSF